jgi:hypothetical protein
MLPPLLDEHLGLVQRREQFTCKQLVSQIHLPRRPLWVLVSRDRRRLGGSVAPDSCQNCCVATVEDGRGRFANRLSCWQFHSDQTQGFAKAEVAVGGIDTRDLSSKTMATRNGKGLYAIGEAVDVTGWLFQWVWLSDGRRASYLTVARWWGNCIEPGKSDARYKGS